MFSHVTKKITALFRHTDKVFEETNKFFKEADELFDQLDVELEGKAPSSGVETETVVEEVRPDGTRVVTRTIVRKYPDPSPKK